MKGNKSSKQCRVAQVAIADKRKTTGDKLYTATHIPWAREGQGTPVKTDQYDLAIMPIRIMFVVILKNLLIS